MDGFNLLVGHLVGDYILQNDWIAGNKNKSSFICGIHCFLYTFSIWLFSFWWITWPGLLICFIVHWLIDRYRLAFWWMNNISGQSYFANGSLAPWSIIIVDNIFHLLTLSLIAKIYY